jgi:hypothetical protein
MAKASDNLFPYIHLTPAAAPAAPAAGAERLYLDSADGNKLKRMNASGTPTTIEGGGGGGASTRVLLKQITLGADTASLAFTSSDIPTSGYSHLQLVVVSRSTASASGDGINLSLNGDTTTANYKYQVLQGASGSVAAVTTAARTIAYTDAASDPANAAGITTIEIPDYLGSWHKIVQSASSKSGDPVMANFMVRWANVAAITAISLTCGANFKAGSKAWLYGLA